MIDDEALATTDISLSCHIGPLKNVVGDIGGIISRYSCELVGAFYPALVSRKVEVVLTELVDNVLKNYVDGDSGITVEMRIDTHDLTVRVSSVATREQFSKVKSIIDTMSDTQSVKGLLRKTIHQRRKERSRGGLGLLRLVAENRFDLNVTFDESVLAVESHIALGGLV